MRRRALLTFGVVVASMLPTAAATPCFAIGTGSNAARVVIEHGEDAATFCLSFEEAAITGLEALRRTGLSIVAEEHGAGQVTLCQIGGIGCAHPEQPCFCECTGDGPCTFWGYYRAHGNEPWAFSEAGAAATIVRDGDVEGWRYGEQTGRGGNAPRTRDGVCVENAVFLAGASTPAANGSPGAMLLAIGAVAILGVLVIAVNRRRRRTA